ncbi:MAG TPA: MerR family transcriptional regulator, partial [Acidimicrobiales bacterium]
MKAATPLRIGELAQLTGVSRRALRHYERQGLLPARRGDNGYRHFDRDAVARVGAIRELLAMGLPTRLVREVLPCVLDADPARLRCPELRSILHDELARLDARAAEIDDARRRIETL